MKLLHYALGLLGYYFISLEYILAGVALFIVIVILGELRTVKTELKELRSEINNSRS